MNKHLRIFTLFVATALVLVLAWTSTEAAQRQVVLIEGFTQWNCPPCAAWNPQERAVLQAMTRDTVIAVKWHGWWPGANNDAFHLYNVPENTARINLYNVTGVPTTKCDGSMTISQSQTALRNAIRTRYSTASPCTIDDFVAVSASPTSISVQGTINAEEDITGKKLFVTVMHDVVTYTSPPGTNGETIFDYPFRDVYPNANTGETIAASPGSPYDFECSLSRSASWDVEDLIVVAWVQNMTTKEIVQSAFVYVTEEYAMSTTTDDPRQLISDPDGGEVVYTITANNLGTMDDSYHVVLSGDIPEGWSHSVEAEGVTPDAWEIMLPVSSLQSADITVRLNPNGVGGQASINVTATSQGLPVIHSDEDFRLMSGLDILVVDDDDNASFETWYENSLDAMDASFAIGRWDLSLDELDPASLTSLDAIVWFTGNTFQDGTTLSAMDQLMLSDYLDAGGRLLLSGQGIGFDIRTDPFMSTYLHSHYERNYPQGVNVSGVDNDVISNGLAFSLTGGTGAGNQTRQSAITPLDEFATSIFSYDASEWLGAVRVQTDVYRVVYLGFGFEAIDDEADRNELMQRSVDWLTGVISDADEPNTTIPAEFALGQNYPNPFNPETVIPYSLPVRADVTLRIFDVLGRQTAELFNGAQGAGVHSLSWNAADQSSGVYFYTIEAVAGDQTFRSTRKLVLMK